MTKSLLLDKTPQTNWQKIKIGDIADVIGGGTPSTKNYDFWNGDISWLTPKDLSGYKERYISKGERNITTSGLQNSSARLLPKGTVLLTSRAPIGYLAIAKQEVCTNQGFKSIILKGGYLPEFFYYLLKNNIEYIIGMSSGSTFAEISGTQVKNLEFNVPDYDTQKKIAGVLGALDDKIELNNKVNNNLEQQAQALYLDKVEKYKEKEIKVEDIVKTANTGADAIQKAPIVDYNTGVKCVRVGDMSNRRSHHDWGYTKVSDDVFTQYQLKKDDIIVTRTASLGLNTIISKDLNAVYNNGLIRLSINKEKIIPLLVYRQFQTTDFENYISKIEGETSVRPNMKINYLLQYNFSIISKEKQEELVNILKPIWTRQEQLKEENTRLAQLRDTLLPKLMSGEIDVSNVNISADKSSFAGD